jgi:hypothetical protein
MGKHIENHRSGGSDGLMGIVLKSPGSIGLYPVGNPRGDKFTTYN